MITRSFGPFLSYQGSVDPRYLNKLSAGATQNIRCLEGDLEPRYGWRNIKSAGSGFSSCSGLVYVQGYNDSYQEVEEYVSFETRSGTLKPWSVNPSSGSETEITNSGGALSLTAGTWRGFSFDGHAYFFRVGGSVVKHAITTSTSWTDLDQTFPATHPAVGITFETTENLTTSTPTTLDLAGLDAADFTDLDGAPACAFGALDGTTKFTVNYTTSGSPGTGDTEFEIDLNGTTAGVRDLSALPRLTITALIDGGDSFWFPSRPADPANIFLVTLVNNAGSPVTLALETSYTLTDLSSVYGRRYYEYTITAEFPASATAADWVSTRRVRIEMVFNDTASGGSGTTVKYGPFVTSVTAAGTPPTAGTTYRFKFGAAYRNSSLGLESQEVATTENYWRIQSTRRYFSDGSAFAGNVPTLYTVASAGAGVDEVSLYVQFEDDGKWRLIRTEEDTTTTHEVTLTYDELRALPERLTQTTNPVGNVVCAGTFRGWVVYGYAGGKENIKHSAIGSPGILARTTDDVDDFTRGATFSLADNFGDEPLAIHDAGDALVIIGKKGIYAQVGDYPSTMTPPKKLPGSYGGYSIDTSKRFRDDAGNWGVAFLSADGQTIWFVVVTRGFDGQDGFRMIELTDGARGDIRDWLTATASPTAANLQMAVDERSESLWLIYQTRALVFRRPSVIEGMRPWERYEYTLTGTWTHVASDTKWGLRVMRSSGLIDELERNSASNFEPITGATRDGGSAMPTDGTYWEGKTDTGPNRRVMRVMIDAASTSDLHKVRVSGTRSTGTVTLASGKRHVKFGPLVQGWELTYRIILPNNSGKVYRMVSEESIVGQRRLA